MLVQITTADGSHSLYNDALDEHYHSIHGAIAESKHVFIQCGLLEVAKKLRHIRVLEVGFGTGLNAFLSLLKANELAIFVEMTSIEAFPIQNQLVKSLNYPELLNVNRSEFEKLHDCEWNQKINFGSYFSLFKRQADFLNFDFKERHDLIYFDAFAPEKQNSMWQEHLLRKLYECLEEGGVFVSYCVKGEIRRRLESIGFKVEKLPGPIGGKREILRAVKNCN